MDIPKELRRIKLIRRTKVIVELKRIVMVNLAKNKQVIVIHHFLKLIHKLVSLLFIATRRKLLLIRSYSIIVATVAIITPAKDYLAIVSKLGLLKFTHEEQLSILISLITMAMGDILIYSQVKASSQMQLSILPYHQLLTELVELKVTDRMLE